MVDKLDYLIKVNDIPNILLYGNSDKSKVVDDFINKIYTDEERKNMILKINCAESNQGGIKFIRDDLRFFGKSICMNKHKTIILLNGDKLTQDAQSALRRCIEIYSQTTRFIMIVDNKDYILNPILSRFCIIHIDDEKIEYKKKGDFVQMINKLTEDVSKEELVILSENLYKKGVSIFDLMKYLEKYRNIDDHYRYTLLCYIDLLRQQIYNEKSVMFIFLYYFTMRRDIHLENLLFN